MTYTKVYAIIAEIFRVCGIKSRQKPLQNPKIQAVNSAKAKNNDKFKEKIEWVIVYTTLWEFQKVQVPMR